LIYPQCQHPGCAFSKAGTKGPCTGTDGILSYDELTSIRNNKKLTPIYDNVAEVNYFVYDNDQWV